MASWTDTTLPQFTPYRQQLPVDAMVSVGLQKQAQYEQGIQRIQSEIDRVAGLDVVRDIDRQYLQSKVNEIGNSTKLAAASDFSNLQLVNSLSGMINQVSDDRYVQNAVANTSRYRKEVGRMEKAREAGKSSIANEEYFANNANKWLSSGNLNESFNAKYMEYVDVDKKWLDVLKNLHSDLSEEDIPYVVNPDGSINYNETAAEMQRISRETVSSSKIENALRASLSPDELQQLNINGWYQFRGVTPQQLAQYSKSKFDQAIQTNLDRIRDLEGIANFIDDPKMKMDATNAMKSLRSMNESLRKDYDDEVEYLMQNPDAAKGLIYKNGAIAQFAQSHAWEHNKRNILNNPRVQAQFERERINQAERRLTWDQYMGQQNLNMRQAEYALKVAELENEIMGNKAQAGSFESYYGQSTSVKSPLGAAMSEIEMINSNIDLSKQEILKADPNLTSDQLENAIELYRNGTPDGKKAADTLIDVRYRDQVLDIIAQEKEAKILQAGMDKVRQEVMSSPAIAEERRKLANDINEIGGLSFRGPNGTNVIFTLEEVSEYLSKVSRVEKSTGSGQMASTSIETEIKSPLTEKEKILYSNRNTVSQKLREYDNKLGSFNKNVQSKVEEEFGERFGTFIPRVVNIDLPKPEVRNVWENIAGTVLSRYNDPIGGTRGGAEGLKPADVEKARTWLGENSDKSNIQYKKLVQGGQTMLVMLKGTEEIVIPLTPKEAASLPLNDPNEVTGMYKSIYNAQTIGNGNTNITGRFEDAYFDRTMIPNTSMNVKADLKWNNSAKGMQYIQLNLRTPIGDIPLTLDKSPVDRVQAVDFLRKLTDENILNLYLSSPTVSEQQKEIIRQLAPQQ